MLCFISGQAYSEQTAFIANFRHAGFSFLIFECMLMMIFRWTPKFEILGHSGTIGEHMVGCEVRLWITFDSSLRCFSSLVRWVATRSTPRAVSLKTSNTSSSACFAVRRRRKSFEEKRKGNWTFVTFQCFFRCFHGKRSCTTYCVQRRRGNAESHWFTLCMKRLGERKTDDRGIRPTSSTSFHRGPGHPVNAEKNTLETVYE